MKNVRFIMTSKLEIQYAQCRQVVNPEQVSFLGALQFLIGLFQGMTSLLA